MYATLVLVVYFDLFTGSSFDDKDAAQLGTFRENLNDMPVGPFSELVKEWRKRKSFLFSTLQSGKSIDLTPKSQEQMIHLFMDQQNWNSKEGVDYYAMPLLDRDDMFAEFQRTLFQRKGTANFGADKPNVKAICGGPGRGKTRALMEIGKDLMTREDDSFAILITYNLRTYGFSGKKFPTLGQFIRDHPSCMGTEVSDFFERDFAKRAAFLFWSLLQDDQSTQSFQVFLERFGSTDWSFRMVVHTIKETLRCIRGKPVGKLLFLVDELMTYVTLFSQMVQSADLIHSQGS